MRRFVFLLFPLLALLSLSGCDGTPSYFDTVEVRVYNDASRTLAFSAYLDGDPYDSGNPNVIVRPGEAASVILDASHIPYGSIMNLHIAMPSTTRSIDDYAIRIDSHYMQIEIDGTSYSYGIAVNGDPF